MISRFTRALALITLLISALNHARGEELLVLRNGYVLSGEVSRVGDRYVVRVAQGSETRIPMSAVEFRCRDLEDAYRQKASRNEYGRVNDRIELIQWCFRHGLFRQAEEQIVASERLDPLNPRLHQLRRRLDAISKTGAEAASVPVSKHRMTSDELDLLMRRLPADAVEQFTMTVQPLLVNRCSTGGCHGPSSETEFRLMRPRPGRELARTFTQRNLHATLQIIDREYPLASPLAKVLNKPHGPNGSVNVNLSKQQVEQVVQWIKSLSQGSVPEHPVSLSATTQTLRQASSNTNRSTPAKFDALPASSARPIDTSVATPDPFDPEVFNRRYHSHSENVHASYLQPIGSETRQGPAGFSDSPERER